MASWKGQKNHIITKNNSIFCHSVCAEQEEDISQVTQGLLGLNCLLCFNPLRQIAGASSSVCQKPGGAGNEL